MQSEDVCPSDAQLIRFAADQEPQSVREHLANCDKCRRSLADIRQVNAMLMQWDTAVPPAEISRKVLARTYAQRRAWWIRIAASVLVSGAVGFAIGGSSSRPAPSVSGPAPETAASSLFALDTLAEQTDLLGTVDWTDEGAQP